MSDTPRCDSEEVGFDDETRFHLGRTVWYVPAGFSRQLERELQDMKLYASYLEDNMSPEALRFAQAGFDIEKSRIPIAG